MLTVEEKRQDAVSLNVNNTGNSYTGDWHFGANYVRRNLTDVSDTLGVALVYRAILPRVGDSLYLMASHSDVDLGSLGTVGGIGIAANGRGWTAGVHY